MRTKANYYPSGFISTTGSCSQDTRAGTYVNLPLRHLMLLPPAPRLRDPISNWSCANAGIEAQSEVVRAIRMLSARPSRLRRHAARKATSRLGE
jgi:hypothetical protein